MRPLMLLIPGAAMAACTGGAADTVLHVDVLPVIHWTEQLRIGSVDDPETGFSRINGVEVAPSGEVYVLDGMANEVRVFDAAGRRLRTVGRAGEGPGEFRGAFTMGMLHDTLWVQDVRNSRISWFDAEGNLLFESRAVLSALVDVGVQPSYVGVRPGDPRPDGTIGGAIMIAALPNAPTLPDSLLVPDVRFDRTGAILDTAGWYWYRRQSRVVSLPDRAFSLRTDVLKPPIRMPAGGGDTVDVRWHGLEGERRGTLDVVRRGPDGDTVFHRRLAYSPEPVPRTWTDSVVTHYADLMASGSDRPVVERGIRDALDVPLLFSPVTDHRMGSDGTVWLRRRSRAADHAAWILITAAGAVRGELRLPASAAVHWSDAASAWISITDEYDVPWLLRLSLED